MQTPLFFFFGNIYVASVVHKMAKLNITTGHRVIVARITKREVLHFGIVLLHLWREIARRQYAKRIPVPQRRNLAYAIKVNSAAIHRSYCI